MDETARPTNGRLRLARSLLQAVEESISPLQRLLAEAQEELGLALQGEAESARDAELDALRREVQQLRDGLVSRAVIERAKGILMHAHGLTEQEAFDLLNVISQRQRRKLRDIAADIANGTLAPGMAVVQPDAALSEAPGG
jgi:hypothetical protein